MTKFLTIYLAIGMIFTAIAILEDECWEKIKPNNTVSIFIGLLTLTVAWPLVVWAAIKASANRRVK